MAYISESYDDNRIVDELRKLRPEINLGDSARVVDVEADGSTGAYRSLKVTIAFPVSTEEWRQILDASRLPH